MSSKDSTTGETTTDSDYVYVSPSKVGANSVKMSSVVSIVGDLQESQAIPQITDEILLKVNFEIIYVAKFTYYSEYLFIHFYELLDASLQRYDHI